MDAKCGTLEDAWSVFNKMPAQNVVTWTAMILGHMQCGQGQKALGLFQEMKQEGVDPDSVTFVGVLKACASMVAIEEGRRVHQDMIQSGLESDVFVGSSLVNMYAKCGNMEDAWSVLNKMPSRNVVTWTVMIFRHVECGQGQKALGLFQEMKQEGVDANSVTSVYLPLKRAGVFIRKSFKVVWSWMSLWGAVWWTCMQSVGAWTMVGECSIRCHFELWYLGVPYLEDVPCMGMVRKLVNILNRCVKKVYSQMILLLFVFCQLVAMQVWWMKACGFMLQWS
jgi:pentatricopeptide repeat protein